MASTQTVPPGGELDAWTRAALAGQDWTCALAAGARFAGADALVLIVRHAERAQYAASADAWGKPLARAAVEDFARAAARGERCIKAGCAGVLCVARPASGADVALVGLFAQRGAHRRLDRVAAAAGAALDVRARLDAVEARAALKHAAFDKLPVALAIVDARLLLVHRNEALNAVLAREDGLYEAAGRLGCVTLEDEALLSAAVRAGPATEARAVRVHRTGAGAPYLLLVAGARAGAHPLHRTLFILDPDEPLAARLCAMHEISDHELALARRLFMSQSYAGQSD